MNRELIIQKLIESRVDYITRHGCGIWLHEILERGFIGFANMPDAQLAREMRQRGIKCEIENKPWPVDEDDDDPESEEDEEDDDVRRLRGECVADEAI
jgi:hypothetical protein